MNIQQPSIPLWRFTVWGIVAAVGVAFLGWLLERPHLFIAAPIAGAAIAFLGVLVQWLRGRPRLARRVVVLYVIVVLAWLASM
jgi:hypothetical protein